MTRHRLLLEPRLSDEAAARLEQATLALASVTAFEAGDVVTLEGGAGRFCEGLDAGWVAAVLQTPSAVHALLDRFDALLGRLAALPVPVVALVDGAASGGGVALAAAADVVLARPNASFALPEVFLGLCPAIALPWVVRRMGRTRAGALALGARPLTANEALAAGLCDEVVDDLEAALGKRVARWGRASPAALAAVKGLLGALDGEDYGATARAHFAALLASDDTRARITRGAAGEPPWLAPQGQEEQG